MHLSIDQIDEFGRHWRSCSGLVSLLLLLAVDSAVDAAAV